MDFEKTMAHPAPHLDAPTFLRYNNLGKPKYIFSLLYQQSWPIHSPIPSRII
jgi:hypothetical protein